MEFTVVYSTSRIDPKFNWFIDSIAPQLGDEHCVDVILVNLHCEKERCWTLNPEFHGRSHRINIIETPPKPTVWQGKHRVTSCDWWAASNARNTGICLCQTKLISFIDDRSFVGPNWVNSLVRSHVGGYSVFGSYQKRMNMVDGDINSGVIMGEDHRIKVSGGSLMKCAGQGLFTCNIGMQLEWLLEVNGFEELCDSLSGEDSILGKMMENRGYAMMFDPNFYMVEDRTDVSSCAKRTDKGVSPNDKSHAALARFGRLNRTEHPWDLREIRDHVLAGGDWPSVSAFPKNDWYDGQPICEFK